MSSTIQQLVEGINEIFPDSEDMEITKETRLGDIPDWDSMAAVNMQTFIQQTFQVEIFQDALDEEMTLDELIHLIENPAALDKAA